MKTALKWIIGIGCVLLILKTFTTSTEEIKEQEKEVNILVSSEDLYSNYRVNKEDADQKFTKKTLFLSGKVKGINKDSNGSLYISLHTGQVSGALNCYIDEELLSRSTNQLKKLENLKKGNSIMLMGKSEGILNNIVTIANCQITEVK